MQKNSSVILYNPKLSITVSKRKIPRCSKCDNEGNASLAKTNDSSEQEIAQEKRKTRNTAVFIDKWNQRSRSIPSNKFASGPLTKSKNERCSELGIKQHDARNTTGKAPTGQKQRAWLLISHWLGFTILR